MKLPIRRILYLVSLAFVAGIVLNVIDTVRLGSGWRANDRKITDTVKRLLEQGARRLPDNNQWIYDDTNPFWDQFATANLTGFRARDPKEGESGKGTPPKGAGDIDLTQKIDLVCISYSGDYTRVVVRYRGLEEVPSSGSTPSNTSSLPSPYHHLQLGDHLWKPLDDFHLVEVADDARSVFFENRAKEKVGNEYPRQEIRSRELELMVPVTLSGAGAGSGVGSGTGAGGTVPPPRKQHASGWQDVPETRLVGKEWHVSRGDLEYISGRGNRFAHEDVGLDDYSSSGGGSASSRERVQGVLVRRLGHRVHGLGIEERDILISLNGIRVKNRAQVILEGKRLWRKGVRRFELVVLRRGREVRVTYRFPGR